MKNNFPTFSPIFDRGTIYLGFLLFESNDLNEAVSFIRDACSKSKNPSSEIMSLLFENGWREHLLAAIAILTQKNLSPEICRELWRAFDQGSWVSPQLAVIAWLRDPNFGSNAQARIRNGCPQDTTNIDLLPSIERHVAAGPTSNSQRSAKGLSALVYLIGLSEKAKGWLTKELKRDELARLLNQDEDFGGKIAEKWLANVRLKSKSLGLEIN
jgi:hypothetical protein